MRFAGRGGLCTPWPAALRAVDAVQADANRADSEFDVDGVGADHFGDDAGEDRARVVVGASGRRVGVRCDARCYFSSANPGWRAAAARSKVTVCSQPALLQSVAISASLKSAVESR